MSDNKDNINNIVELPKVKRGRPTKAALQAARSKIGRPKETTGRIAEFKERLLATSGPYVIDKVIKIALDDKHPGQMAAIKMCMDRVLPISLFEKSAGARPQVQINIVNATQEDNMTIDIPSVESEEVDE